MAAPALSEAPPHGICCHLHKNGNNSFNKDQAFKPQEVIRNLSCKGCLPSVSLHVLTGFPPQECVAEKFRVSSRCWYEIVKVQVRAFPFCRINPSPIKLGKGCLPTPFCKFFYFFLNFFFAVLSESSSKLALSLATALFLMLLTAAELIP